MTVKEGIYVYEERYRVLREPAFLFPADLPCGAGDKVPEAGPSWESEGTGLRDHP